jgi:hypothetical protein
MSRLLQNAHEPGADPERRFAAPILSEFLTKEELAAELQRNPRTLDRWAALRIGPPRTRVGRKVLYRRASVQKWLIAQEQPTTV